MNKITISLVAYSKSTTTNEKLATFVVKIPKFIWGHIISHRALSRNSASSRATPAKRIRKNVLNNPFLPIYFGENKPGMQSGVPLRGIKLWTSKKIWLWSRYVPVMFHYLGEKIGIHKEVLNRLIEPWLMVDVIITATEWNNFITLRANEAAQPEIRYVAEKINELLNTQSPVEMNEGDWHLPFILPEEVKLNIEIKKKVSVARCARVSYALFDGKTSDIENDLRLCERLSSSGHWSPFEHVAQSLGSSERMGNLIGWKQYRKEFINESGGDY